MLIGVNDLTNKVKASYKKMLHCLWKDEQSALYAVHIAWSDRLDALFVLKSIEPNRNSFEEQKSNWDCQWMKDYLKEWMANCCVSFNSYCQCEVDWS